MADMAEKALLCLGMGFTATALARRLMTDGWRVTGTTRSADKAGQLEDAGVHAILWRGDRPCDDLIDAVMKVDAILVSTPPRANGCPAFHALREPLSKRVQAAANGAASGLSWLGYLSTNGVYGDHGGAWVNEDAALYPGAERSRRRVAAEADWAMLGAEFILPVIIFRLPGIYGPGRSPLDAVRAGTAKRIYKEGQVFSRAHVEDIATVLMASLAAPEAGDLFNIADDEPAPPQDVVAFACSLLGVAPPPLAPLETAALSEMGRSFYQDNKRVCNQRMKDALGVVLRYPTYRDGLKAILASETGRTQSSS